MTRCPHCGEDIRDTSLNAAPNAQRMITLEIPESEWSLWRLTLSQMNTKFGMRGQGSLANMLTPWLKRFHDDVGMMRYFDDARLTMAYKVIGNGWPCTVVVEPSDRTNAAGLEVSVVTLRFELEDGSSDLEVSSCAPHAVAADFKAYLEDYIARTTPLSEETEGTFEDPKDTSLQNQEGTG